MDWQNRAPRVPNRELVAAALRSEGLRSRVPRLAGVSPNELSKRMRDSSRFHDEFEAAIAAAWAAAHGGRMPDGTDAEAVISTIRERLDRQRADDYRHARERQQSEEARRVAFRAEAAQREAAMREQAAREMPTQPAATSAAIPAATSAAIPATTAPRGDAPRTWDDTPSLLRVPLFVFALITWPLVRPILKTSPGWPRVIIAVLYWGWLLFLVIFLIRSA